VEAAVGICRRAFDTHIALTVEHDAVPLTVTGNPVQLEQVLVNLLVNARDAVLESATANGAVSVHVRACDAPEGSAHTSAKLVCIEVIDNGIGMSEQVRARIFEPFFTTKGVGKGTGLGLATSYAVVRDHGGTLTCMPAVGGGTIFSIMLPASAGEVATPEEKAEPRVPAGTRVLLVDDDDAVRSTLGHVLGEFGIHVSEARTGEAALQELTRRPDTDVVLLDRSMPGGPGERFVLRMREVAPQARIVFLSGQDIHAELAGLVDAVVSKPVRSSALLAAIEQVLTRARLAPA
jgi:two-component system cell cycle sensor histidine kinase/response regulator CckA